MQPQKPKARYEHFVPASLPLIIVAGIITSEPKVLNKVMVLYDKLGYHSLT